MNFDIGEIDWLISVVNLELNCLKNLLGIIWVLLFLILSLILLLGNDNEIILLMILGYREKICVILFGMISLELLIFV